MSEAFDILSDVKVDLCAAEASLTQADGGSPETAVVFRKRALDSVAAMIKRGHELEKVIEYELCVPP